MGAIAGTLAVLIPGVGKMLRRKYVGGAIVMIVWLALVEGYILVRTINPSGIPVYSESVLLAAAISFAVANAVLEALHLARQRQNRLTGRIDVLYADALTAFTAGEDARADELLKQALSLDELNVDCLFLRAEIAIRLGRKRRARRLLSKCRAFDENGKWVWETTRAIERL